LQSCLGASRIRCHRHVLHAKNWITTVRRAGIVVV
jgi:DNA-binding LytR/AlgR family response regulator